MANLYPEHDNFKVDEDVMFTPSGTYAEMRGKVAKVSPSRVTVEHGNETTVLHRSKYGAPFRCRRVTAKDIAQAKYAEDVAVWERARPKLEHFNLSRWFSDGDYTVRMDRAPTATRETMEQIADEAYALAEWLRKRPEEPK